ncbi:MAG: DUF2062 domain-containing protein [Bacteroidales bacterium]
MDVGQRSLANRKRVCIIIPTYNNGNTLGKVINGCLEYNLPIIVVNDGSTDHTSKVIGNIESSLLDVITFSENQGKGIALKKGFDHAFSKGYLYAITLDSDGQHHPSDISSFLEVMDQTPLEEDILIIGERNMNQKGIPQKSNFGRKFSNFWFMVETGLKSKDTQSGFRLYPLKPISEMRFYTKGFDFEIEVLVRLVWKRIPLEAVDVHVTYFPEEERVSHFKPFNDFMKISLLNSILCIFAWAYYLPVNYFKNLTKKGWKEALKDMIMGAHLSPHKRALSISLGLFMGIAPVWGFQMLIALGLAKLFRLKKGLVILFANISIPPLIPFIIFGSLLVGAWITDSEVPNLATAELNIELALKYSYSYFIGAVVFGALLALSGYVISRTLFFISARIRS